MDIASPYIDPRYQYVRTYIGLPIPAETFAAFPQPISWRGNLLLKRENFHMTICKGEDVWAQMRQDGDKETAILDFFNAFVVRTPIKIESFTDDFRYVEAEDKRAVMIRCAARHINEFFRALNATFGIDMPMQPTHVTLYTLEGKIGVHIPSVELMEACERVVLADFARASRTLPPPAL